MQRWAAAAATAFIASAFAQGGQPTITPIYLMYIEAPPGRDKAIAPIFAGDSLEKIEVQAVVAFPDRLIVDKIFYQDSGTVVARAELTDGKSMTLGSVQVSSQRRNSEDRRKTLISFGLSRLPDKPIARVFLDGQLEFTLARAIAKRVVPFDAKVGAVVDAGLGKVTVSEVSGTGITLKGGGALDTLARVNLVMPDGSLVSGERGSYSSHGGGTDLVVESGWRFKGAVTAGKLELFVYEGIETRKVPVKLTIRRPF